MSETSYRLTIVREGYEPRSKIYVYAKAAQDGFTAAVLAHSRLASEITLDEVTENQVLNDDGDGTHAEFSYTTLKRWTAKPPTPAVIYDFTEEGISYSDISAIVRAVPSLGGFDEDNNVQADVVYVEWQPAYIPSGVVPVLPRAQVALIESGILDDERLPVLVLPSESASDGDFGAIIIVLYFKKFGRYPLIVTGYEVDNECEDYTLVDLNKIDLE